MQCAIYSGTRKIQRQSGRVIMYASMAISIHIVFRLVDFGTEQCASMRAHVCTGFNNNIHDFVSGHRPTKDKTVRAEYLRYTLPFNIHDRSVKLTKSLCADRFSHTTSRRSFDKISANL